MAEASTPLETTRGYSPPTVSQFAVFLDNKVGRLLDVVELFDAAPCQVCALCVHEASDHAVVRLITNDAAATRRLLKQEGLAFSEHEVLVVELSAGHTLTSLCTSLLSAELNIQFAYPLMNRPDGAPTVALAVDDAVLGGQILRRKNFRLFGEADLPHD